MACQPAGRHAQRYRRGWLLALVVFYPLPVHAVADAEGQWPRIAVIIDDMGYLHTEGLRALELPGPVTFSFLPHTPHAQRQARLAHRLEKEVMLHLPMESKDRRRLGPGGVHRRMGRDQVERSVMAALASVPHVRGVNNHMGSRLTEARKFMRWIMQTLLSRTSMFFIDSRTSSGTVAQEVAQTLGLPNSARDVFLDPEPSTPASIRRQFRKLIEIARLTGSAIAIGHPKRDTIRILGEELGRLAQRKVKLVPVSSLIPGRAPVGEHRVAESGFN